MKPNRRTTRGQSEPARPQGTNIKFPLVQALCGAVFLGASMAAQGENLILNGDFEMGPTYFSSDYEWSPASVFAEETYSLTNTPASVHPQFASFPDHTSGTGLMIVANGGDDPGTTKAVWRQTVSVEPENTYLFSAWAASAFPDNPTRFLFFVNGRQQGTEVDLPSQTGRWQNYSATWFSGGITEATLEVRPVSTAQHGNDFCLDDLTFRKLSPEPPPTAAIHLAVQVSWPSVSNQLYQVQWSPDVAANVWFALGPPVAGTGISNQIYKVLGGQPRRFYRILPVE